MKFGFFNHIDVHDQFLSFASFVWWVPVLISPSGAASVAIL